tara:strand:- start:22577 stop:22807 length:231 start_codon:yes stop_codon:yes gene_type:complete
MTDKTSAVLKWLGTALFLAAGLLISSNIEISRYGYVLFGIGHLLFMYVFWKDKPMLAQNIMFSVIDVWGIYNWFIK